MAVSVPVAGSAAASVLCAVLIAGSYVAFPALRLDPARPLVWWSAVDGLMGVLVVWQYVAPTDTCEGFAFFTQLFMLTSQTFFATFAIDLVHTLRQPFDRVPAWAYFVAAWAVGLASAVVLRSADVEGISVFGFCWVRQMAVDDGFNWWLWGLFYIPTSICFVVAWYASLFGAVRLRRGLPRSFAARARSTRALQLVVHVNFSFFCACGLGYVADLRYARGRSVWLTQLVYAAFSAKGVVDMLLWLVVQARSLAARAPLTGLPDGELHRRGHAPLHDEGEGELSGARAAACGLAQIGSVLSLRGLRTAEREAEQLAHALREEVLEVTLKGIRTGVRRAAHAMEGGARLHSSDQYAVLGDGLDTFPFFDYRPHAFARLRELAGVSAASYLASLSARPTARSKPGGRSGAFLYTTADSRFLIKTCSAGECATLVRVLDSYTDYVGEQPATLLCRFVGCHAIEMYSKRVHFLVMCNVFAQLPHSPTVTYDLKGSHVGRSTSAKQSAVKLDNDLAHTLWLQPHAARLLAAQLRLDVCWLTQRGLLDYSLIVGLLTRRFFPAAQPPPKPRAEPTDPAARACADCGADRAPTGTAAEPSGALASTIGSALSRGGAATLARVPAAIVEGPGLFAFGIIDILQTWNWRKRIEYFFKAYVLLKDSKGFSAVRPEEYGRRFVTNVVDKLIDAQADATDALLRSHGERAPAPPRAPRDALSSALAAEGAGDEGGAHGAPVLWFDASEQPVTELAARGGAEPAGPNAGLNAGPNGVEPPLRELRSPMRDRSAEAGCVSSASAASAIALLAAEPPAAACARAARALRSTGAPLGGTEMVHMPLARCASVESGGGQAPPQPGSEQHHAAVLSLDAMLARRVSSASTCSQLSGAAAGAPSAVVASAAGSARQSPSSARARLAQLPPARRESLDMTLGQLSAMPVGLGLADSLDVDSRVRAQQKARHPHALSRVTSNVLVQLREERSHDMAAQSPQPGSARALGSAIFAVAHVREFEWGAGARGRADDGAAEPAQAAQPTGAGGWVRGLARSIYADSKGRGEPQVPEISPPD
ncbi:hypothetical protein KFE25_005866 [Diacronema lutheri]|uniref:PIPK domain-containing protein n=1 Tax=Diacronema lutheri TaxID=2081491 RepID=A0A8J5XUV2_DIALT|nr:hypothetical protein KFE25_005866 [Diacronema lutheri]